MQRTIVILGMLVLVIGGSLGGFYYGNSQGLVTGYNSGYTVGTKDGYNTGFSAGDSIGYNRGDLAGYSRGNTAGIAMGYTNGFKSGNTTGYSLGEKKGYALGETSGYTQGYQSGWTATGFNIKDPTYQQMLTFIQTDTTNLKTYVDGTYVCHDYTSDVKRNAFNVGYRCFFVYVELGDATINPSHALVAFNTTDRGIIYIEPQSDKIMDVKIGQPYWDRTIYMAPYYDDTVTKIELIP
jgi:hypothetical protein